MCKRAGAFKARELACGKERACGVNTMSPTRKHIPLLYVLNQLKDYERQIIVDSLDSEATAAIERCVRTALVKKKRGGGQDQLQAHIRQNKEGFGRILKKGGKAQTKRRELARLGGNPLATIITTALPLLVKAVAKHQKKKKK